MTNTNRRNPRTSNAKINLDNFHPALDVACGEQGCGALAHQECAYEIPATGVPAGMVAYRSKGEHNAHGRCADGTGPAWGMVHTSRLAMARTERAERLPDSEKAGAKALATSDGAVPSAKSARCYVAIGYMSQGGEIVAMICGPMTPAAASQLRSDMHLPTNVVPVAWAHNVTPDDALDARVDGRFGSVRVVTLPSQYGSEGVEVIDDAPTVARPVPVAHGQADWLDAIAV